MSKPISVLNVLLFLILVTGCATYQKPDWSQYKGPGKEYFVKEEVQFPAVPDNVEPMNRVLSGFNHGLMTGIVQPFSWVYRSVLPSFARTGIGNAFDNAYYPVRILSNTFQGKWEGAWQETRRFAINTTYGVLGLWDRATEMNIKPVKEDFGKRSEPGDGGTRTF
jgi:phospholipid-binding lipoprotein MlaA